MNVMEYVRNRYLGTTMQAETHVKSSNNKIFDLDCNNGDDDCAIEDYES